MQTRFCLNIDLRIIFFSFRLFISCLYHYIELDFCMGLLQFAYGLSITKGESPKDSYSTKPRKNPD